MTTLLAILAVIALCVLGGAAGWYFNYLIVHKRNQKLVALADLFDARSTKLDGTTPIRNYFLKPSILGLFRGRPASVACSGVIRISVAGRFVLPFQVRPKSFSWIGVLRGSLRNVGIGLYFLVVVPRAVFPPALVWKFAAAPVLLGLALISVWLSYGRIGDVEFPKNARFKVLFQGSAPFSFSTDFPSEFSTMISRTDIQTSLLHIMNTHRVDHLRAVAQSRPGEWDSRLEANFFYHKRLLDPAAVRELLTDLLTLCERIEASGRTNEAIKTTVTQPA